MTQAQQIGLRIVVARRARNLTQHEAAERSGLSRNQLSQIERGHFCPSAYTLIGLCRALDVSADHLLGLARGP